MAFFILYHWSLLSFRLRMYRSWSALRIHHRYIVSRSSKPRLQNSLPSLFFWIRWNRRHDTYRTWQHLFKSENSTRFFFRSATPAPRAISRVHMHLLKNPVHHIPFPSFFQPLRMPLERAAPRNPTRGARRGGFVFSGCSRTGKLAFIGKNRLHSRRIAGKQGRKSIFAKLQSSGRALHPTGRNKRHFGQSVSESQSPARLSNVSVFDLFSNPREKP